MQKSLLLRILAFICMAGGIVVLAIGIVKYHEETVQQEAAKEFKWDDAGQLSDEDIDIWIEEDPVSEDGTTENATTDDTTVEETESETGTTETVDENMESSENAESTEDIPMADEETVHEE